MELGMELGHGFLLIALVVVARGLCLARPVEARGWRLQSLAPLEFHGGLKAGLAGGKEAEGVGVAGGALKAAESLGFFSFRLRALVGTDVPTRGYCTRRLDHG